MTQLTTKVMGDFRFAGGFFHVASYGAMYPSWFLETVDKAKLLVGYFDENRDQGLLTGAIITANKYPHVEVRVAKGLHAKYWLTFDGPKKGRAYIGSSNLGSSAGEVGILTEDLHILRGLKEHHEEAWEKATPMKAAPKKINPAHAEKLLKAPWKA